MEIRTEKLHIQHSNKTQITMQVDFKKIIMAIRMKWGIDKIPTTQDATLISMVHKKTSH